MSLPHTAAEVQAAIRALPRDGEILKTLLVAVQCYATDLYEARDCDAGPMTREDWRDEQAGMDAYRRAA